MESCYDPIGGSAGLAEAPPSADRSPGRRVALLDRWLDWCERVDSEWAAASEAFRGPGAGRKWLGWALYRIAAKVNPEIRD